MNNDAIRAWIKGHESYKIAVYEDSEGYLTVGIGHKIAVGDKMPEATLRSWFQADYASAKSDLAKFKRIFQPVSLGPVREAVLIGMFYQMGWSSVMGFRHMIEALEAGEWEKAADEILDSRWHNNHTPARAEEAAEMMRTGKIC